MPPRLIPSIGKLLTFIRRDTQEAIPIARQLLAIREKALGPEHPDTANSLNNLAVLYEGMRGYTPKPNPFFCARWRLAKKRSARIIPTPQRASTAWRCFTKIWATTPKPNPFFCARWRLANKPSARIIPNVAESLNNMAVLYIAQGRYEQAEPLFKRALAI